MKKHKLKLVAMLLAFVGVLMPNQVFADTTYKNVPEKCYKSFDTFSALSVAVIVTLPVDCTLELENTDGSLLGFVNSNSSILEANGSTEDGFILKAKKVGVGGITLVLNGGDSEPTALNILDIASNNSLIVNNTVKQYLLNNYSSYYSDKSGLICNGEYGTLNLYCRVGIYLTIEDILENDLSEDEQSQIGELLGNGNIISYGDISLETRGKDGNFIENINSFGKYTVDVLWGGLDLGEPADGYERNFYVVRLHDGKKIPAEVDDDGNLIFPISKFGTFAVVYEDVESEDAETKESSDEIGVPDTGVSTKSTGNTILSIAGCIVAGVGLSLVMFSKVKKYTKK